MNQMHLGISMRSHCITFYLLFSKCIHSKYI